MCIHGSTHFLPLPPQHHVFLLFSHKEIATSCNFWLQFFKTYDFVTQMAPKQFQSNQPQPWVTFWELYLLNSTCFRARILCWIGAIIAGIGPVFTKKSNVSHGSYPVYFNQQVLKFPNCTSSFLKMIASLKSGCILAFDESRLLKLTKRLHAYVKQSHWTYSLQCTCQQSYANSNNDYHVFTDCQGPLLHSDIPLDGQGISESDKFICHEFVKTCRALVFDK